MKKTLFIFIAFAISIVTGCSTTPKQENILTVDFQKGQVLLYKFVSSRDVQVNWDPANKQPKSAKGKLENFTETLEMTMAYKPIEVNPYGLTTIEATCRSIDIKRTTSGRRPSSSSGKLPLKSLLNKSFTFTVDPTGKIADGSRLNKLVRQTGQRAFRIGGGRGRVKDADMVPDFVATQWFLWDPISSLDQTEQGFAVGQTWQSKLSIPLPMVLFRSRDVTYTLEEVQANETGRTAIIKSSFTYGGNYLKDWPYPYGGKFQVSGRFGFISGYKVLDLTGQGREVFNIDTGQTENYSHNYTVKIKGSLMPPLNLHPVITVKQTIKMQKLEDEKKQQ
ncbi:MAG: hypothetical protein ACYST9_04490 [Planctomycetota bacterium]